MVNKLSPDDFLGGVSAEEQRAKRAPRVSLPDPQTKQFRTPRVTEFFQGFRSMFETEEATLGEAQVQLGILANQQARALQTFSETPTQSTVVAEQLAMGISPNSFLVKSHRDTIEKLPTSAATKEEIAELGRGVKVALDTFERAAWRIAIMSTLPVLIQAGKVGNIDDLLTIAPLANASSADTEFAQELLNQMLPVMGQVLEANDGKPAGREDIERIFKELTKPKGDLRKFLAIDSDALSVEQTLEALHEASLFTLPEGVTEEELREMLQNFALSDAEVDEVLLTAETEASRLGEAIKQREALFDTLRQDADKLVRGDIVSAIEQAKLSKALSQPALLMLKPAEYWVSKVNRPLAGIAVRYAQRLKPTVPTSFNIYEAIVGEQEYSGFEKLFQQARAEGLDSWEAHGKAFEEWEANWALKFAIEVIADPITYVGFGIYTKVFSKLPLIGKGIGALERGYVRAAEFPFHVLRQAWLNVVPRTLTQRSITIGNEALKLTTEYMTKTLGKKATSITPDEAQNLIKEAIKTAFLDPQGQSLEARVGKILLGQRVLEVGDLKTFTDDLGLILPTVTIRPGPGAARVIDMHVAKIDLINDILNLTDFQGITKFLRPNEAAPLLLRHLEISDSPENLAAAVRFIANQADILRNRALAKAAGGDMKEILTNIQRNVSSNWLTVQQSTIAQRQFERGVLARSLQNVANTKLLNWALALDRVVTAPFARAYLLFAFYSPMNVLETAMKTGMAGINPFWRGRPASRSASLFMGKESEVPADVLSESKFLLQAQFPEEATLNLSGVKLSQTQMRAAREDVRGFVDKVLSPRWLKKYSGFDWGADMGGAQRSNYWNAMYSRLIAERHPEVVRGLNSVITRNTLGFDELPKGIAQSYRQEIFDRLLTGDLRHFERLLDDFTPNAVHSAKVAELFDDYDLLGPHIADFVVRKAEAGELWAAGPAGVNELFEKQLKEVVYEQFFGSPEMFQKRYADFMEELIKWNPTTTVELNFKMNAIDQSIDTFGTVIHTSLSSAVSYGDRLANPIVKAQFYNDFWDKRMIPHLTKGGDDLVRTVEAMKAQLPTITDMTPSQNEMYVQLLDKYLTTIGITRNARIQQRAVEREWFDPAGAHYVTPRKRDAAWWDAQRVAKAEPWKAVDENLIINNAQQIAELKSRISGLEFPMPIDASQRVLVKEDVAKLFGTSPDVLQKNMYVSEMLALRGKKSFVSMVRGRANTGARQVNPDYTADTIGYTEESVGRIYDEMMFHLKNDPNGIAEDISPMFKQLESARADVLEYGIRKDLLLNDESFNIVRRAVENISVEATRGVKGTAQEVADSKMLKMVFEPAPKVGRMEPRNLVEEITDSEVLSEIANAPMTRLDHKLTEDFSLLERQFTPDLSVQFHVDAEKWSGPAIRAARNRMGEYLSNPAAAGATAEGVIAYRNALKGILQEHYPSGLVRVYRGSGVSGRGTFGSSKEKFLSASPSKQVGASFAYNEPDTRLLHKPRMMQSFDVSIDDVLGVVPGPLRGELEFILSRKAIVTTVVDSPWQQARREALQETRKRFTMDFPDYDGQTAVSAIGKTIYPFWGYETHRWMWWLPREYARHPGVYSTWGKYMDNTDQGYIHIPGTNVDVNPLRGTIFQGGMRRLFIRDFPEFYDNFAGLSEVLDAGSRWGFYPGAPITITQAMFGAASGQSQLGETLPGFHRSALDVLTAIAPDQVGPLRDVIFSDRFRDFQIGNQVSVLGGEGMLMLNKRTAGEKLTPEEQALWNKATQTISLISIPMEQTALFRFRPEEKNRVFKAANAIISDFTGLPESAIVDMRRYGLRVEDVFGPLPPEIHKALNALEGWSRYTGGSAGLLPSELGQLTADISRAWDGVADVRDVQKQEMLTMEASMRAGTNNMTDWLFLNKEHVTQTIAHIDVLRESGIPMTLDERLQFASDNNVPLPQFHPVEELRDLLFAKELETIYDPDINAFVPDWDGFFLYREMVEFAAGDEATNRLIALNREAETPLQQAHFWFNRNYRRPYNASFDAVLSLRTEAEQRIILLQRRADTPTERERLQAELDTEGRNVVSAFSTDLRQFRKNMRQTDPDLDAWLMLFGIVDTAQTTEATERFKKLRVQFGLPLGE